MRNVKYTYILYTYILIYKYTYKTLTTSFVIPYKLSIHKYCCSKNFEIFGDELFFYQTMFRKL